MKKGIIRITATVACSKDNSIEEHSFRCANTREFMELVRHLYYCEMDELKFRNIRMEQA